MTKTKIQVHEVHAFDLSDTDLKLLARVNYHPPLAARIRPQGGHLRLVRKS